MVLVRVLIMPLSKKFQEHLTMVKNSQVLYIWDKPLKVMDIWYSETEDAASVELHTECGNVGYLVSDIFLLSSAIKPRGGLHSTKSSEYMNRHIQTWCLNQQFAYDNGLEFDNTTKDYSYHINDYYFKKYGV